VVVQCPSCQSRFRVADEKVTERGVRVRCTVCKNVFPVKKGAAAGDGEADAKRPSTGPLPTKQGGDAKRLDIDDLFGMDELVGEVTGPVKLGGRPKTGPVSKPPTGPISNTGPITKPVTGPLSSRSATGSSAKPGTGPISRPATGPISKPVTGPLSKPSTGPVGAKPATGPVRPRAGAGDLDLDLDPAPGGSIAAADDGQDLFDSLGPAKSFDPSAAKESPAAVSKKDPFDALEDDMFDSPPAAAKKGSGRAGADRFDSPRPAAKIAKTEPTAKKDGEPAAAPPGREGKKEPVYRSIFRKPAEVPRSTRRELISSALTGLVGASLAIVVMFVAALSDEHASGWLGYGARDDFVATRIASGVYDTAAGRPVLFVRGRVENRGKKTRAVRVVAELVGDSGVASKAETLAGSEPGPEDVYALSSAADAQKLMNSLESGGSDRMLGPGKSAPFFAVFADAPQDLQGEKLHVRFEAIDAAPRTRSAQRAR
jgi:predicted Zn finger-like uncharacterized protein